MVGLAAVLSSCTRGVDLRLGNPCDHPLLVAIAHDDAPDRHQRDARAIAGRWLQWGLLPAHGVAVAGDVSDAAGVDDPHTVWVDGANFRTTVTFNQVENQEDPIWLSEEACTEDDAPKALALIEPGGGEDPSVIHVAGPEDVVEAFVTGATRLSDVDVGEVEQPNSRLASMRIWPESTGHVAVLAPLADLTPPSRQHMCDRIACADATFPSGTPPPLYLSGGERVAPFAETLSRVLFLGLFVAPPVYLIVKYRRRRNGQTQP